MDIFPTAALSVFSAFGSVVTGLVGVSSTVAVQLFHVLVFAASHLIAALSSAVGLISTVVVWPFSLASAVAFLILSPVIYTVAYTIAPFWYLASVVPRLEPLYIFFGSAAFVGVIVGICAKFTSDAFVSALRLNKSGDDEQPLRDLFRRPSSTASTAGSSLPSSATGPAPRREDDYFLTGSDIDWQVIDRIERVPNNEHMRRMPLLQSIILEEEEDDSSVGGY